MHDKSEVIHNWGHLGFLILSPVSSTLTLPQTLQNWGQDNVLTKLSFQANKFDKTDA